MRLRGVAAFLTLFNHSSAQAGLGTVGICSNDAARSIAVKDDCDDAGIV
jgi:hypothetical protein